MPVMPAIINGGATLTGPSADGTNEQVLQTDGSGVLSFGDKGGGGGTTLNATNDFRLTTESGEPVSTSDRASQSTIYLTPFKGNRIALYDGADWSIHTSSEVSLALSSLTSGKNYDVFAYDDNGTLTLELSAAWTNDTTRADAITRQDGVWVKSGATTRRLVGTIRTTSTSTTEDSAAKRFVWNAANRVPRTLLAHDTSAESWSYSTSTWRQWNADTGWQVEAVAGLAGDAVDVTCIANIDGNEGEEMNIGIALDSTGAPDANSTRSTVFGSSGTPTFVNIATVARYTAAMAVGYHYWVAVEHANLGSPVISANFTSPGFRRQSKIQGVFQC